FTQCSRGREIGGHDFQWQRPGDCEGATWPRPGRAADSIEDLARESGDQRLKLQQELAARQAAMKQYKDRASAADGQTAVVSAEQYRTLAQQLSTWRSLRNRKQLVAQAEQFAKDDVAALTADRERVKAEAAGLAAKPESGSERIERLQRISAQQNIL